MEKQKSRIAIIFLYNNNWWEKGHKFNGKGHTRRIEGIKGIETSQEQTKVEANCIIWSRKHLVIKQK